MYFDHDSRFERGLNRCYRTQKEFTTSISEKKSGHARGDLKISGLSIEMHKDALYLSCW